MVVLEGDQLRAGGGVPQLGAEVGGAGGGAGGVPMNKYEGFTVVSHFLTTLVLQFSMLRKPNTFGMLNLMNAFTACSFAGKSPRIRSVNSTL